MRESKNQIKGWEDLTLDQMALLMRDCAVDEQGRLRGEWENLRTLVDQKESPQIKSYVMWIGAYLLTFAAVYHAQKETGISEITFKYIEETIAQRYHLDLIAKGFYSSRSEYSAQVKIISKTKTEVLEKMLSNYLKKLPAYIEVASYFPMMESREIKAKDAFFWLKKNNEKKYPADKRGYESSQESDEKEMGSDYRSFIDCLNSWSVDCAWLWKEYEERKRKEPLLRELEKNEFAKKAKERIENGTHQIIFTGAPGTGKSYTAKQIAEGLGTPLPSGESEIGYTLVQFHPSYDYTDFVEGLRPVQVGDAVKFFKLDGHFRAFCRKVAEANREDEKDGLDWTGKKYFFLIDEINRAELSKVFGELMYCLEADKRGPGNRVQTQYGNLPTYDVQKGRALTAEEDVFADGFFIPANVIVIGTMNEIDRSVESMDFALRRRFDWMEAVVDLKALEEAFQNFGGALAANGKELAKSVDSLNKAIEEEGRLYDLDRQYFISHGQFSNLPKDKTTLQEIKDDAWKWRIEPLLREYLRGEGDKDIGQFVAACRERFFNPGEYDGGES